LKGIDPPVASVLRTFDESSILQLVDKRNQPAGKHPEPVGDFLLTGSFRGGDDPQRTDMGWRQPQRSEPLGKLRRGMGAQLSQQERR
jgi:hypothetical protein